MKKKRPLYTYTSNLHLLLCLLLALVVAASLPPCARAEATLWGNTTRSLGFGYRAEPGGNDSIAIGDDAMSGSTNADSCVAIGTGSLSGLTNSCGVIAIGNSQFAGAGNLTNVTAIGNHFFAADQSDVIVIRAAESDPRRAPILYGSNHLYLNATNGVYVNGRELGEAAFADAVGAVASVNGATGAVSVTCASIGALATNGVAASATYADSTAYATNAASATSADSASQADYATTAGEAGYATAAGDSDKAKVLYLMADSTQWVVSPQEIDGTNRVTCYNPNPTGGSHVCAFLSDLRDLSGQTYDFQRGTNFTLRLYQTLTNIINRLGGTVTNAPSFD